MTLPTPWMEAYLRIQTQLDATTEVSGRAWGLEAALDAILAEAAPPAELTTIVATAERRERHRARLRRTHSSALQPVVDQPAAIEARVVLEQVRRRLHPSDWQLIKAVGIGTDYRAIGRALGATASSLRVRAVRIRKGLASAA